MTAERGKVSFWLLLGCWLVVAAVFAVRTVHNAATTPLILDTDDAMRLAMVHDFLGGQGWFDTVQHRLNTPFGGEMHWSRLVDLPEALLLAAVRPFAGGLADTFAAYLWPLGLLLVLLYLNARLALRLAGPEAQLPALLLPAFSVVTMAEFAPGRFDHHSAQILLTLAMLYCVITALERPRYAIGAGLAAATAIAIGIEGLPMAVATALAFGLAWAADPRHRVALRDFGLSFALSALLQLAIALPPSRWLAPMCDAISVVYVAGAVFCGLAFVLLSLLPIARAPLRLLAGLLAGLVVGPAVIVLFPGCLGGPYAAVDPWLQQNWLARVAEAQTWVQRLAVDPAYPIAIAVPSLLALAVIVARAWRGPRADRAAWLAYGLFLVIALAITLTQIRGARIAASLAVPAGAWLIVAARTAYLRRARPLTVLALVGSWLGSAGVAIAVAVNLAAPFLASPAASATAGTRLAGIEACLMPSAFAPLAALPPTRIMAPIDLGSHLLLFTPHSVVAAPYHRNEEAVLDAFAFFDHPIAEARDILRRRGVTLVVICPAMPEVQGAFAHADDSFVALYAAGRLPGWLVPQPPSGPLQVFAVAGG